LGADSDTEYDGIIEINLDELEPLISRPHSPDSVVPVREVAGTPITQVLVGSCTNSSYTDLQTVSDVLKGKTVHPSLSFGVTPGSRQVYTMIARSGALGDIGAHVVDLTQHIPGQRPTGVSALLDPFAPERPPPPTSPPHRPHPSPSAAPPHAPTSYPHHLPHALRPQPSLLTRSPSCSTPPPAATARCASPIVRTTR